jgi:hypothetical protein
VHPSGAKQPLDQEDNGDQQILAVGIFAPGTDMSQVQRILPTEVRETAQLYLDGKIDQWYSLEDRPGVVFILNMTDTQAAHAVLGELPLGKAHWRQRVRNRRRLWPGLNHITYRKKGIVTLSEILAQSDDHQQAKSLKSFESTLAIVGKFRSV